VFGFEGERREAGGTSYTQYDSTSSLSHSSVQNQCVRTGQRRGQRLRAASIFTIYFGFLQQLRLHHQDAIHLRSQGDSPRHGHDDHYFAWWQPPTPLAQLSPHLSASTPSLYFSLNNQPFTHTTTFHHALQVRHHVLARHYHCRYIESYVP
jgi:hypothetical protein